MIHTIQLALKQNGCMIQLICQYENLILKVPRRYHEILVYEFGEDYMTPPPADKQIPGNEKNYWID